MGFQQNFSTNLKHNSFMKIVSLPRSKNWNCRFRNSILSTQIWWRFFWRPRSVQTTLGDARTKRRSEKSFCTFRNVEVVLRQLNVKHKILQKSFQWYLSSLVITSGGAFGLRKVFGVEGIKTFSSDMKNMKRSQFFPQKNTKCS